MAKTYSAGVTTAYGAAKKAGYTGTYEQFCADQANFARYAQQVREDKESVKQTVETFTEETVPEAVQSVEGKGTEQIGLVNQAGTTQVQNVNNAGTTQTDAVNLAGTTNVNAVNQAGETQVNTVNQAGATQVQAVEDKGEEVLASIPSDYSDLTAEVDDLTRQLNDKQDAPSTAGTAGQVLGLDDQLQPVWSTPSGGGAISSELKTALLQLAQKVAYVDTNGQDYYDDLYHALYPSAVITSITAVFTQGSHTVYENDTLDSLKPMLVVTAEYDDGSSETVPSGSYSLNGTLVAGTSTVTVVYGNETTTFQVVVTGLPVGYTKHDYIMNSAASYNSIIDTGLIPQYNGVGYEHDIEFMITEDPTTVSSALYGLRSTSGSDPKSRAIWIKIDGTSIKAAVNYGGTDTGFITTLQKNTKLKSITKNGQWYIGDTLIRDNLDTGSYVEPSSGTIKIFGISTGTASGSPIINGTRIYRFKVIDETNETVIADLVPCENSENVAGLYDLVRASFYTAGTPSNIIAGDDA